MNQEAPNNRITRPLLRYHGGKYRLAPWIISHFPAHRTYTEVYGGAGSVLLQKPRAYSEVYNDLNGEAVNLFRVLQDPAKAKDLINVLKWTPYARAEFVLAYTPSPDPVEAARRLIIRSYMGFASGAGSNSKHLTGFRSNTTREGTTPAHDWVNLPDALWAIADRLRGPVIENRPAIEVLRQHDRADALHYVDPPYPHNTRTFRKTSTHNGYAHEMSDADHEELLNVLMSLDGMVILSSYPNSLYTNMLAPANWVCVERAARADGARARVEVLWKNPAAAAAQQGKLAL